jgi:hypothetical protein
MSFSLYGNEVKTVFGLAGSDENSATKALGWTLQQSPEFLLELVGMVTKVKIDPSQTIIKLQNHKKNGGVTDLEIFSPGVCHIIFEAKKGWELPAVSQLSKYSSRLNDGVAEVRLIVSLSAASQTYASLFLPKDIGKIPLSHISWENVHDLCELSRSKTKSFVEKMWLGELSKHLGEYMSKDRESSNLVYVVSVARKPAGENPKHTYVDVVEKDKAYFHQVGNSWPVSPPNYIGFRYDGKLQSVHHIEEFEVVKNLASLNANWPRTTVNHFVYKLGPPMKPAKDVLSENIWTLRVKCTIDTLLSGKYRTIREARDATDKRLGW